MTQSKFLMKFFILSFFISNFVHAQTQRAINPQFQFNLAITKNDAEKVKTALSHGANVNLRNPIDGMLPIHEAIYNFEKLSINEKIDWKIPAIASAISTLLLLNNINLSIKRNYIVKKKDNSISKDYMSMGIVGLSLLATAISAYMNNNTALKTRRNINNAKEIIRMILAQPNFILDDITRDLLEENPKLREILEKIKPKENKFREFSETKIILGR